MPKNRSSEARLGQATSTFNFTWEELSEKGPEVSPLRTGLAHVLQAAPASQLKTDAERIQYHTTDLLLNFHKTIRPTSELKGEFLLEYT